MALESGEEKEVSFVLDFRSFAYYETRIHDWLVERGLAKRNEEQIQKIEEAMGAGAERMRQQMMMEMPLNALISYGRISEKQLEEMIEELNR